MSSTSSSILVWTLLLTCASVVNTDQSSCQINEVYFPDLQVCEVPETLLLVVRRTANFPNKTGDDIVLRAVLSLNDQGVLDMAYLQALVLLSLGDIDTHSIFIFVGAPLLNNTQSVAVDVSKDTIYDVIISKLDLLLLEEESDDVNLNLTFCYDRSDVSIDDKILGAGGPPHQDQYLDTLFDLCGEPVAFPILAGLEGKSSATRLDMTCSWIFLAYMVFMKVASG